MAYQGRKVFQAGEVLTASDLNSTVDQTVMVFADGTARDTAIPTAVEGMICYLESDNSVLKYDGSDWVSVALDINLDADRAVITNSGGDLVVSDVTATELGFLDGVTSNVQTQFASKQDDLITTQGDLIIGDGSGDASRLAIGAQDTVLTSDGTTATWLPGASGGGITFLNVPFNVFAVTGVDFPADSIVRFSVITTSSSPFTVSLFDSNDDAVAQVTVDRDNPFSYFTDSTAVAKVAMQNDVANENIILVFTDPLAAVNGDVAAEVISITNTQNITTNKTFDAYVFGGGGNGGGGGGFSSRGGGGGSGRLANGQLPPGNYTATIGGGGGGVSSIGNIEPAGAQNGDGSNGGDGGSGGGSPGGGQGGFQGNDGTGNNPGIGSGTPLPTANLIEQNSLVGVNTNQSAGGGFYGGGGSRSNGEGNAANALTGGGQGSGVAGANSVFFPGGTGGAGFILLVEA